MQPDPLVVARRAQELDDPLALAQRIDAHQMSALGKGGDRAQQLADLAGIGGMMEDRQGEGRLGDEDIAGYGLERRAGCVRPALVVARDDDALAPVLEHGLRGAQDMAGRHEAHLDIADLHGLAVFQRLLGGVGHVLEAGAHDGQRLGRGEHTSVARPGMIAMAVRDHRAGDRDRRIDVEIAGRAIEAAWSRIEPGAGI